MEPEIHICVMDKAKVFGRGNRASSITRAKFLDFATGRKRRFDDHGAQFGRKLQFVTFFQKKSQAVC
jgi:hypothetical protein